MRLDSQQFHRCLEHKAISCDVSRGYLIQHGKGSGSIAIVAIDINPDFGRSTKLDYRYTVLKGRCTVKCWQIEDCTNVNPVNSNFI